MTSSNGSIFRVIGYFYVEVTGHRWIPRTQASDAALWCFFIFAWLNGWVNNVKAGDLKRYRAHYDVIVMIVYYNIAWLSLWEVILSWYLRDIELLWYE